MSERSPLLRACEEVTRSRALSARLDALRREEQELSGQEQTLRRTRAAEQADVDRLERNGPVNWVYRAMGRHEDKLAGERREAAEAASRHEAVLRRLEALRGEKTDCLQRLSELEGCEQRCARLLDAQAARLLAGSSPASERLRRLEAQLEDEKRRFIEIGEAETAGRLAQERADAAEELLSSAANLGAWDLLGGGVLADCLKHSRLDEAQSCIHALQVQLGRFEQELADVKLSGGIMLEVGGFLRFADIFVDDIFSGAMVLGRIRDARGQVSSVAQQLHGTMQTLCRLKAESLHRLGALQEERTQLLLQTEREQAG